MSTHSRPPALLFHGSTSPFLTARVGTYDGVFWAAEDSATAQTYIPECGSRVNTGLMSEYRLKESLWPQQNDVFTSIAADMGYEARDPKWDRLGRAQSFGHPANGWPTYREICEYIEKELGYQSTEPSGKQYELKLEGWSEQTRQSKVLHKSFSMPGFLKIISGHQNMKLYDMSRGEGDLTDVQYHKLSTFKRLEQDGWDGVTIDDFTQSKTWGNVGHRSHGFFSGALKQLTIQSWPATHFDWDDTMEALHVRETTAYSDFLAQQANQQPSCPALAHHSAATLALLANKARTIAHANNSTATPGAQP